MAEEAARPCRDGKRQCRCRPTHSAARPEQLIFADNILHGPCLSAICTLLLQQSGIAWAHEMPTADAAALL